MPLIQNKVAMSITYKSLATPHDMSTARDTLFETFGVAPDERGTWRERAPQAEPALLASARVPRRLFVIPHYYASMQSGGLYPFPTGCLIAKYSRTRSRLRSSRYRKRGRSITLMRAWSAACADPVIAHLYSVWRILRAGKAFGLGIRRPRSTTFSTVVSVKDSMCSTTVGAGIASALNVFCLLFEYYAIKWAELLRM